MYTTKQQLNKSELTELLAKVQELQAASNTPQDFDFYNACINKIDLQLDLLCRE